MATPAVQDMVDLRMVINTAANAIGDLQNPNRGWGFGGSSSQMGTADLINNITSTVLQSKFQIDTNMVALPPQSLLILTLLKHMQTAWLNLTKAGSTLNTSTPAETPTLPISTSLALPTVLPTSTPSPENTTSALSASYIDYVSSIPNLSTSLTSLGRAWHREMNSPINEAIGVLQESIATLQTTMLQHDLINSSAVMRTVRASSSLESAQAAWSRFLNLPGSIGSRGTGDETSASSRKRSVQRMPPANGRQYTHQELWGWKKSAQEHEPSRRDVGVASSKQGGDRRDTAQFFRA